MSTDKSNRLVRDTAEQKLLGGTQQYIASLPSLTVGSQKFMPADFVKILQDRLASSQTVQTAATAHSAAVKMDRAKRAQTDPAVKALKGVVRGMFPESPDILAAFGLDPVKVGQKTVATKAEAIAKNAATREARHTMGKKEKLAIKGTPPSATTGSTATTGNSSAPSAPTASPVTAPASSPASVPVRGSP
jgi:hypothetical protein